MSEKYDILWEDATESEVAGSNNQKRKPRRRQICVSIILMIICGTTLALDIITIQAMLINKENIVSSSLGISTSKNTILVLGEEKAEALAQLANNKAPSNIVIISETKLQKEFTANCNVHKKLRRTANNEFANCNGSTHRTVPIVFANRIQEQNSQKPLIVKTPCNIIGLNITNIIEYFPVQSTDNVLTCYVYTRFVYEEIYSAIFYHSSIELTWFDKNIRLKRSASDINGTTIGTPSTDQSTSNIENTTAQSINHTSLLKTSPTQTMATPDKNVTLQLINSTDTSPMMQSKMSTPSTTEENTTLQPMDSTDTLTSTINPASYGQATKTTLAESAMSTTSITEENTTTQPIHSTDISTSIKQTTILTPPTRTSSTKSTMSFSSFSITQENIINSTETSSLSTRNQTSHEQTTRTTMMQSTISTPSVAEENTTAQPINSTDTPFSTINQASYGQTTKIPLMQSTMSTPSITEENIKCDRTINFPIQETVRLFFTKIPSNVADNSWIPDLKSTQQFCGTTAVFWKPDVEVPVDYFCHSRTNLITSQSSNLTISNVRFWEYGSKTYKCYDVGVCEPV